MTYTFTKLILLCISLLICSLQASTPFTPGLSFLAMDLGNCIEGFSVPPDTIGAVGPTQYIAALNQGFRSFDKLTGKADDILNVSMSSFFNHSGMVDPRIRYDRFSQRWFMTGIDFGPAGDGLRNTIYIAFSDSPVITKSTVWTVIRFLYNAPPPQTETGLSADYDTLGIDAHAVYIGVNFFGSAANQSGDVYQNSTLFVVQKSSLFVGKPIINAFRDIYTGPFVPGREGNGAVTPQAVDNFDPNPEFGYFVSTQPNRLGQLAIVRIANPGSALPTRSPVISVPVQPTALPRGVPHKGNVFGNQNTIDALDDRLISAHVRDGQLYTSHSITVDHTGVASSTVDPTTGVPVPNGDRTATRWYQLDMTGGGTETLTTIPTVRQVGTLYDPSITNAPCSYWMATVMTNKLKAVTHGALTHNLTVSCSTAGPNNYVNTATATRAATDPLHTLNMPILLTNTTSSYNYAPFTRAFPTQFSGGTRWGDFSYTSPDPVDDLTLWTTQQFVPTTDSWGVQVTKLLPS